MVFSFGVLYVDEMDCLGEVGGVFAWGIFAWKRTLSNAVWARRRKLL